MKSKLGVHAKQWQHLAPEYLMWHLSAVKKDDVGWLSQVRGRIFFGPGGLWKGIVTERAEERHQVEREGVCLYVVEGDR